MVLDSEGIDYLLRQQYSTIITGANSAVFIPTFWTFTLWFLFELKAYNSGKTDQEDEADTQRLQNFLTRHLYDLINSIKWNASLGEQDASSDIQMLKRQLAVK